MKTCTKCGERLPLSFFHRRTKSHDGLASQCQHCRAEYRFGNQCSENSQEFDDIYTEIGSLISGVGREKSNARKTAKQAVLSCGYGTGKKNENHS